jgi:sulfite exporter TauE/SafE
MIWPAFLIGIFGSLHCLGMCGPIALALPIKQGENRFFGIALYNTGRIITYGLFGILFGGFGSLFMAAGLQQFLSIVAGVTVLIIVIMPFIKKINLVTFNPLNKAMYSLKATLGFYLKKYSLSSLFVIGLLNGLLPCGLVYIAIVGAIATGNSITGSLYMIFFGMGTAPAMLLMGFYKNSIPLLWRSKLIKFLPVAISIIGLMLIFRGLNLGIPYLSPKISSENPIASQCCKK